MLGHVRKRPYCRVDEMKKPCYAGSKGRVKKMGLSCGVADNTVALRLD